MNTKFKIGDKVRLKDPKRFTCGNKVLIITDFVGNYVYVTYKGSAWSHFPLYSDEIYKISVKGEQLLLFEL